MPARRSDLQGDQAPPYARLSLRQAELAWFVYEGAAYSVLEAEPQVFAAWFEEQARAVTRDDPPRRRLTAYWFNQMGQAASDADTNKMSRVMSRWWALDALLDVAQKRGKSVPLFGSFALAETFAKCKP